MEKTKKIASYVMVFAVIVVCLFQIPVYAPGSNLVTEAEACSSVEYDMEQAAALPISFHQDVKPERPAVCEALAGLCTLGFFINAMMSLSMMRVVFSNEEAKRRCMIQAVAYGTGTIFGIAWFVSLQTFGPTWGGGALGCVSVLSGIVGTVIFVQDFVTGRKIF